jgi:hypothetical protein
MRLRAASVCDSSPLYNNNNKITVALVRERTIPTERPPLVGEVTAKFADRGVSRSQRSESPTAAIPVFKTGTATFSSKYLLNCTHEA